MTLGEKYVIDRETLEIKAGRDDSYWQNVKKFVEENWDTDVEELTFNQRKWLEKIELDLAKAEGLNF